jgi:hypothetical protein
LIPVSGVVLLWATALTLIRLVSSNGTSRACTSATNAETRPGATGICLNNCFIISRSQMMKKFDAPQHHHSHVFPERSVPTHSNNQNFREEFSSKGPATKLTYLREPRFAQHKIRCLEIAAKVLAWIIVGGPHFAEVGPQGTVCESLRRPHRTSVHQISRYQYYHTSSCNTRARYFRTLSPANCA